MKKAFSLIELLIVISLIAILTAVVIPTIRSFSPTFKLNNSTRIVQSKLRQAQEEAISNQDGNSLRFNLSASPISFQLIRIAETETEVENGNLADDITMSFDPAAAGDEIIFGSDGGPNWSGQIDLTLAGNTKTIDVSPAGVIKIE